MPCGGGQPQISSSATMDITATREGDSGQKCHARVGRWGKERGLEGGVGEGAWKALATMAAKGGGATAAGGRDEPWSLVPGALQKTA
jgi:hypothetical protein